MTLHTFNAGGIIRASDLNDNFRTHAIQTDSNTAVTATAATQHLLPITGVESVSGDMSLSRNVVTLPYNGWYVLTVEVLWTAGAAAGRTIWISLNGATVASPGLTETVLSPGGTFRQRFAAVQRFNAGDTLGVGIVSGTTGITARVERFAVAMIGEV